MGACVGRRSVRSFDDERRKDERKYPEYISHEISDSVEPLKSGGYDAVTETR